MAQPADEDVTATVPGRDSAFRRATTAMAGSTVLSRVTGFGRVFALAYALGFDRSRLTDTYNLANTTPNIVYELVLGGVLSATLVPVFVDRLSTRDEEDAWQSISAIVTVAVAALVGLTVAFALAAPWIIRVYTFRLSGEEARLQQSVATDLLRMFAPQVFLYGLIAVSSALLHARRRFVAAAATPILNNLVVIGVLVLLPHTTLAAIRHDRDALLLLGLGTTAGVVVQAVALVPSLRRSRLRLRPVWAPGHEAVRTMLRLSGWTFGYVVANQVALWVVLVLANGRTGAVSAYQAAYMFLLLPHAIFAVSVMTTLLPDLSERWAMRDVDGFRSRLSFGLRLTAFIMVPAAAGYLLLAHPIISLVLEHGRLSAAAAGATADVLALFAIGLPAFSGYLLLMRAYQAMQNTRAMFVLYCIENAVNIGLGLALYPALGVQGLGLALSLAYVIGTGVALFDLRRRLGGLNGSELATSLARTAIAAIAMTAAVGALSGVIGTADGIARDATRVGVGAGLGASVFAIAARMLGATELSSLVRTRRSPGSAGDHT